MIAKPRRRVKSRAKSLWKTKKGQPQCVGWFHELVEAVTDCDVPRTDMASRELARLGVRVEYDLIDIMLHRRRHLALGAFTLMLIAAGSGLEAMACTMADRLEALGWFITLSGRDGASATARAGGCEAQS
jgi:hypothetical protein